VNSKVDLDQKAPFVNHLPSIILKPIFGYVMSRDEKDTEEDHVTLKELMPTLKFDIQLVNETEGKLQSFTEVKYYCLTVIKVLFS
jgi:hypothetical protein